VKIRGGYPGGYLDSGCSRPHEGEKRRSVVAKAFVRGQSHGVTATQKRWHWPRWDRLHADFDAAADDNPEALLRVVRDAERLAFAAAKLRVTGGWFLLIREEAKASLKRMRAARA
jgi:hypothetical protein